MDSQKYKLLQEEYDSLKDERARRDAVHDHRAEPLQPEQASLAVPQVREAGMRPLLMYRTGRAF